MRAVASNWRFSGALSARSGNRLNIESGLDNAFTGIRYQRPNQVSGDFYTKSLTSYFNRDAFAQPTPGTLGNLPCALRGADEFMKLLCDNLGIKVGETTADGFITLEAVTCLAACDKAPMFQTQGPDGIKYHENMTVDRTMELISVLKRSGREVKS